MATTYQVRLSSDENGRRQDFITANIAIVPSADGIASGVVSISEASASAIPLGGIASPGFAIFRNLDSTNFITLGYDSGGFVSVMAIGPLQCVVVSLDDLLAAPYAQADTAACLLDYLIISQ